MFLKFRHTEATVETNIPLEIKTNRYFDQLKLVQEASPQEVKLGFLRTDRLTPDQIINTVNLTGKTNRLRLRDTRIIHGTSFVAKNNNYIFTDKKSGGTHYWYCVEFNEAPSNIIVTKITQRGETVVTDYIVEGTRLYHNYRNEFKSASNFSVYHLSYSDSTTNYNALLEARPVIREIVSDDIDEDGNIYSDRKRFYVEKIASSYYYTFYNCSETIYVRANNEKLTYSIKKGTIDDSIYMRFKLSNYQKMIGGVLYNYDLPELTVAQEFDSSINYSPVSKNIIKVEGGELINEDNKPITIVIRDANNNLIDTYSNQGTNPIDKIDYIDGFIILPRDIKSDWSITISGYQKTEELTFQGLDINPLINSDFLIDSYYLFYWKPNDLDQGIHYLHFVNEEVVDCSDTSLALVTGEPAGFNTNTVINKTREEINEEFLDNNESSSQNMAIVEVHFSRTKAIDFKAFPIKENALIPDDFDFATYHQISMTDLINERGFEFPLNNTVIVGTTYSELENTSESAIKEALYELIGNGKLILIDNLDDPKDFELEDDGEEVTVTCTIRATGVYSLYRNSSLIATPITGSSIYQFSYTSPNAVGATPESVEYKLTITEEGTEYDTTGIIYVYEGIL